MIMGISPAVARLLSERYEKGWLLIAVPPAAAGTPLCELLREFCNLFPAGAREHVRKLYSDGSDLFMFDLQALQPAELKKAGEIFKRHGFSELWEAIRTAHRAGTGVDIGVKVFISVRGDFRTGECSIYVSKLEMFFSNSKRLRLRRRRFEFRLAESGDTGEWAMPLT